MNNKNNFTVYENINLFLDNTEPNVTFCVANNGISDMVKNLIISANKNNINLILFALDNKIVEELNGLCNIVKYFDNTIKADNFYNFNDRNFKDIVYQRYYIGNQILKKNKTYIYIDIDIVIKKNFVDDVLKQYENNDCDCLIQYNGIDCCTGFFSMRPTNQTIKIDHAFFKKYHFLNFNNDQSFWNLRIYQTKFINIKFLSREDYPNGGYFYKNSDNIQNNCYIIHFNGIIGHDTKVNKMKYYNEWYL